MRDLITKVRRSAKGILRRRIVGRGRPSHVLAKSPPEFFLIWSKRSVPPRFIFYLVKLNTCAHIISQRWEAHSPLVFKSRLLPLRPHWHSLLFTHLRTEPTEVKSGGAGNILPRLRHQKRGNDVDDATMMSFKQLPGWRGGFLVQREYRAARCLRYRCNQATILGGSLTES